MDKNYFAVYKGIVEDNKDPEFRNRLKVRVREIYGMEGSGFRTEDLPWATPSSNIITYPPYDIGTIVYVVFDNGDPYYPIYTGYFVKPFPESQCYNCLHYFAAKRCKAFPNGIPELIFFNEFDHRDVYYDSEEVNDHDIVFTYKNSSSYDEIYGVSWKLNDSSSTGERTYYAKGLVANVGVDDQSVYNSFNELSPWCDRRRCNGYYNENNDFIVTAYEGEENYIDNNPEIMVYVETPLFYYFDGIKDGIEQKLISPNPIDGFLPSPACVKDDGTISNFSYSAAYESSVYNGHGTSYSGSFTDENAKQYSKFSIKTYYTDILLMCVEFATKDLSSIISGANNIGRKLNILEQVNSTNKVKVSNVNIPKVNQPISILENSSYIAKNRIVTNIENIDDNNVYVIFDGDPIDVLTTYQLEIMPWKTGSTDDIKSNVGSLIDNQSGYPFIYRGKENLYGNGAQMIMDLEVEQDKVLYDYNFSSNYNSTSNSDNIYIAPLLKTSGTIKSFIYNEIYPWVRIPSSIVSGNGYYCDGYFYKENGTAIAVGYGLDYKAGAFVFQVLSSDTTVNPVTRYRVE